MELRCKDSSSDVASPVLPTPPLLSASSRAHGAGFRALYARALHSSRQTPAHTSLLEVPLARRMSRPPHTRLELEKIDEEIEPVDKSLNIAMDIETEVLRQSNISKEIQLETSEMPTQHILTESHQIKRVSELDKSAKRQRASGIMSYHVSQEAYKENSPCKQNEDLQQLRAILQEAGFVDVRPRTPWIGGSISGDIETPIQGRNDSHSETPLGSLDRTKVSLGESKRTTDSERFIREEWDTVATMHKIYNCIRSHPERRVTMDVLLEEGPPLAGHKRIIAARVFTSILRLKQHDFIVIHKNSVTQEIENIELGERITSRHK